MKLRMAQNSLFAVLLRSRWWVSALVVVVWVGLTQALLPAELRNVGSLGAIPFAVIAAIAGWRQLRAPNPATLQARLDAASAMGWPEFEAALRAGFERQGWTVAAAGQGADLRLEGAGATTLVSARRWKAARHGEEAVQGLRRAMQREEAPRGIYVALGELTPQAARLAREGNIELLQGAELALRLGA